MSTSVGTRRSFAMLGLLVAVIGASLLIGSLATDPLEFSPEFVVLLIAALVSENYSVAIAGWSISIVYPLAVATMVLCGPSAALVLATVTSVSIVDFRHRDWSLIAYNFGQLLIGVSAAVWVYVLLGGVVLLDSPAGRFQAEDFPQALLPLAAMVLTSVVTNTSLASLGVATKSGTRAGDALRSVGLLPLGQVALGVVGVIIAQVMAIDIALFALFIFPLLVARQFYQRYTALQAAFTDTLRSLIGALEAKDPYTRGHSERVSKVSVAIGRQCGLDARVLDDLETAALLHDLGKLALPGSLLRKQGRLTDEDWESIKRHPAAGAEMISRIPPLRRLSEPILSHHERMDGSGYPRHLTAQQLGQMARILAVADSYDAMTSDRPYRQGLDLDAAILELTRCSGITLDSEIVEALVATLRNDSERMSLDGAAARETIGNGVAR